MVGEPHEFGDLPLGEQVGIAVVQRDAAPVEVRGERVKIGFIGHCPTGVQEFVYLAGVDGNSIVDVVYCEADCAIRPVW